MGTSSSRPVVELPATIVRTERSRRERSKLRRELGRLDAVCLLIAAIVVLDTLGAVARGGTQTIGLLAIVTLLFFLAAGMVIAELGAAPPHQGGPYVWARLAFGRLAGSLVALAWWLEAPVWLGGSLARAETAAVGSAAWAGLGWTQEPATGRGLFVELHGGERQQVDNDIKATLDAMIASRPLAYGDIRSEIVGIECRAMPVCAVAVAIYRSEPWDRP